MQSYCSEDKFLYTPKITNVNDVIHKVAKHFNDTVCFSVYFVTLLNVLHTIFKNQWGLYE
jgi:hypothetical protein